LGWQAREEISYLRSDWMQFQILKLNDTVDFMKLRFPAMIFSTLLIFERIREELRDGRSPQQAIHFGYDNAFSTILDANITTFIAGMILFAVGTGPIKGFSITLMIGIVTSMFTAIVVTRVLVNLIWGGKRVKKLAI
jgi:preprotein translocase subunit SecD